MFIQEPNYLLFRPKSESLCGANTVDKPKFQFFKEVQNVNNSNVANNQVILQSAEPLKKTIFI